MNEDIQSICIEIVRDPEIFEKIISDYLSINPDSNVEEFCLYLADLIAKEFRKEALEDKIRQQRDITRSIVLSKVLDYLPDSPDGNDVKSKIKHNISNVSNSSTSYERENLADLIEKCSTIHTINIKKRITASSEITEEIKNG